MRVGVSMASTRHGRPAARAWVTEYYINLTRRLAKGLQLLASYTYAKSIDNASGDPVVTPIALSVPRSFAAIVAIECVM